MVEKNVATSCSGLPCILPLITGNVLPGLLFVYGRRRTLGINNMYESRVQVGGVKKCP